MTSFRLCYLLLGLGMAPAVAEEGMWTLDRPPLRDIEAKLGVKLSKDWLDHARLSALRIAGSCSASFVSPRGLVMTNHHCVRECVEQISTSENNYVKTGFLARTPAAEVRCPEMELNQLVEMTDVTARVQSATAGLAGEAYGKALKAVMSDIEGECATTESTRCDVVTLYRGAAYNLYKYRRIQEVRLAFAPEEATGFFGGDPDNFTYPRYCLDVAFLRAYEKGAPIDSSGHFFRWSKAGAGDGEPTFVVGNPGSTDRLMTVAQLQFERDLRLIKSLLFSAEYRGFLAEFRNRGPEQEKMSGSVFFSVENSYKARRHIHAALLDPILLLKKQVSEAEIRARVADDPDLRAAASAWADIERALDRHRRIFDRYVMLENTRGFRSKLLGHALELVRLASERSKPNSERLREYVDSNLPAIKQELFSSAPIHDEFEIATLTFSLTKLREEFGPDDPFVRRVFGVRSPTELATALIQGSSLKDVAVRQRLFDGGAEAVKLSTDAMVAFVRDVLDPAARAIRDRYEDEIKAPIEKAQEHIARALFKLYGTDRYPDATGTMRLSYGRVRGVRQQGIESGPFTTLAGAFARHTGRPPFDLPASWLAARSTLALDTPFNFASTNDIIGGNSGSPVLDRNGEIVGVVFDGNLLSLSNTYVYDEETHRTVSVHSAAIIELLKKVYGADELVSEITGAP